MRLFEIIKQKCEESILAKAQKIEEERQAKLDKEKQRIENLLNSSVPNKDYIVELHYYVIDDYANILYGVYDYYLCNIRKYDFGYGDKTEVIKITGDNFGDKYTMYGHGYSISSIELYDKKGILWEGETTDTIYIPEGVKTIRDLNNYAKIQNDERKEKYEEKKLKTQQINEKFFK